LGRSISGHYKPKRLPNKNLQVRSARLEFQFNQDQPEREETNENLTTQKFKHVMNFTHQDLLRENNILKLTSWHNPT
jgi:hypothetical protein